MGHIHTAVEKVSQHMVECARFMPDGNGEGDFIRFIGYFHFRCDDEETGVIVFIKKDIFFQYGKPIQLRRRPACYGRLIEKRKPLVRPGVQLSFSVESLI